MAAATAPSSVIDFKSQATFPIRLGTSVLKPSTPARFTSVRFNHKPKFKGSGDVKAVIREGDGVGESKLLLEDDAGEYKYAGRHVQDEDSYVLVVRGQGKEKEMVLERMGSSHGFNLTSTPSQSDAKVLADKYPHLPQDDGDEVDLFGDNDEDMPPDESNPFDYRHFLKAELEKQETAKEAAETARSSAGTPLARSQAVASSTPMSKPAKPVKKTDPKPQAAKKRKNAAAEKPNPKRVKAGQEPPVAAEPAKPKTRPEIPKINLDRKASLRRPSLDDSGELILENETPVTEKPPKHNAMALALSGQLGGGPISLRSAASSPGSHIDASPAPQRPEGMDEEYVFEFDDSPEPSKPDDHTVPEDDGDADADEDEDDADVEDLELPSPAQGQRANANPPAATNGGDDDDDLDAQLAAAMMEEDDGGNQESEESEEE
ncbi:hypothetical protein M409DRAFT_64421 [Zasmidium cellare ATCC 36951]|uniref:Transcription elongation factor Eaf N-terminal domain-containing protein n=1 Tax=Zasmidium cellare ATCC 36951 TaxID=1080233 RepID=A0A6A6CV19_ZASCE|nr:uncharacterized protein M409DRAFT_64421 [Zasmidium cellare ATCC 36951]KAF2170040.1 hypothetical protein M409DRAFT_64421 [Zasmidium cellare ATCC 36951]